MSTARHEFEAIARANGGSDFSLKQDGRYAVQNIQSRWVYFKLGWDKSSAREPLTHEQRFDLLTKFEPHKNKWEAPAILIDMVEAVHGIRKTHDQRRH